MKKDKNTTFICYKCMKWEECEIQSKHWNSCFNLGICGGGGGTQASSFFDFQFLATLYEIGQGIPSGGDKRGGRKGCRCDQNYNIIKFGDSTVLLIDLASPYMPNIGLQVLQPTAESPFTYVMILVTSATLSSPSFYPHRSEFLAPFHTMWPRIENQNILKPGWAQKKSF